MSLDLPLGMWGQLVTCAVSVLLAMWLILGSRRVRSRRVRWGLLALRLVVLLILFTILAAPVGLEDADGSAGRQTTCFLVDSSGSMGVGSGITRFADARGNVTAALRRSPDSSTEIAFFDEGLRVPAEDSDDPWSLPDGLGEGSSLAKALGELLVSGLERGLGEVVVFSDGRIDDRQDLGSVIALARRHGVPVSTFPLSDTGEPTNVAIENCFVPPHVPRGSRVRVRGVLRVVGVRGGVGDLVLRRAGGAIVQRRQIPLEPGLHEYELALSAGREDEAFSLEISHQEGELSTTDNQFTFDLTVREPLTRVLYMEGSNHKDQVWGKWEYDYFREAFLETGHIQVDVLTVDKQMVAGGRLYRLDDRTKGYPESREELFRYDVVICSDINRSIFSEDQLRWTVELVTQRGGGFCMIGGYTAFGAGGWDRTVWEQMIPMDMQTLEAGYVMEEFQPAIPDAAREHPILQIDFDPDRNRRILDAHPPFMGTNLVNRAKPGATVLVLHPEREMPVISVQSYGRGRSMAFTSDAAGGWGDRYQTEWGEGEKDNRHYRTFWANVVTWLGENSLSRHRTELAGFTESTRYRTGEVVRLRAALLKEVDIDELAEKSVSARLDLPNAPAQRLTLSRETRDFRGEVVIPDSVEPGTLEVVFMLDGEDEPSGQARCAVEVTRVSREFLDVSPDPDLLKQLAASTGGRVLASESDLRELLRAEDQDREQLQLSRVPLWDKPWVWAVLIALLTAEWITRKIVRFR